MKRQRLSHGGALQRPGHPSVYKTEYGTWASTLWTAGRTGALTTPQTNTSHRTWKEALAQVERWHRSGKWRTL